MIDVKNKIKFISKYIILCFFIFFCFEVNAAEKQNISLKVVKCNSKDLSTFDYDACIDNYLAGDMDSFEVPNGGDVEPGDIIMIIPMYTVGTDSLTTGFNASIKYDSNMISILDDPETPGTMYSYFDNETYPHTGTNKKIKANWTFESNNVTETSEITIISSDQVTFLPLDSDLELGYFYAQVSDTATPGTSLNLKYSDEDGAMWFSDADGAELEFTKTNFTMNIYGSQSHDATLKNISVKNGSTEYQVIPGLNTTDRDYIVYVPNNITSIDLNADANNEYASVASLGTKSLNIGENKFDIIVTSQFGNIETYTVNVYRLSDDATLKNITLTNGISIGELKDNTYIYNTTIPYATKTTYISATPTHDSAYVDSTLGDINLTNYGDTTNKIDIIVKAENCHDEYSTIPGNTCTTKTYTLNISRENPSSNNYLSDLKINDTTINNFNKENETYTIDNVSNDTTNINVSAIAEDSKANVTISGENNLIVGDNIINITVTAEDGTQKTYKINVRRLSNDTNLSSLTFTSNPNGTLSPSFTPSFTGDYTYTYDPTVTSIDVTAYVKDTGKAKVEIINITDIDKEFAGTLNNASATFDTSVSKIAVIVKAEDDTTKTYTIILNRTKSSNNYLSSLSIEGATLTPAFTSTNRTYSAFVKGDIDNVVVNAVPAVPYATIKEISGNTNLSFGTNTIEIVVKAENGNEASYIINLTREKYDIATLNSISVDGNLINDFNKDTFEYTLDNVPYETTSLTINGEKTNSYSTVTGFGHIALNTGDNSIQIKVKSHDGKVENTYIIHVYREKNSDNSVHGITVAGIVPTINSDGNYVVTLPNSKSSLKPSDLVISAGNGATINKGTDTELSTKVVNEYPFSITNENGIEKQYKILVTREKSNDSSISKVTLSIGDDDSRYCLMESNSCTIDVPVETTEFSLEAIINAEASIVPVNGTIYQMDSSTKEITLTVTAEDRTISTYTVNVNRQKSSNNDLKSLTIDGVSVTNFNSNKQVYNEVVAGTVDSIKIDALTTDTGKATILTDLTKNYSLEFGSNQIDIIVQAENGNTKTYTIFVTRSKRIDATLKDLTINNVTIPGFDPTITEYILNDVDYNTTALNINAIPNDDLATKSGDGLVSLKTGDNTIEIIVSAHNRDVPKTYKISVNRKQNSDAGIKSVTVSGINATLNSETNKYEVTVPNNIDIINDSNIIVTPNDPATESDKKATISIPELELTTKNINELDFVVTAEDGTTKTYTLAVTRKKSNVATLDSLVVTDGAFSPSFNKDTFAYNVTIPVGTIEFDVSATKTDSNSKIISGVGHYKMDESTKTIEIVVISEDESVTNTYILNVNRTKSSINTLKELTVSKGTLSPNFESTITSYTVNVDGDTTSIDVNAVQTDDRASISGTGTYNLVVGENTITVQVKAESGSILNYVIKVIRAKKSNAYLSSLTVDNTLVTDFNKETYTYTLEDVPYSKTSIKVDAIAEDSDATIEGIGEINLTTGLNEINVVVTAQNGNKQTYIIKVTREKNNNAKLSLLSISGYTLTPNFDGDILEYTVTVSETLEKITKNDVTAIAEDSNATIEKQEEITLSTTSDNYYEVVVTAEDETPKTYKIKIIRPKSSDATIKSINLTGANISPEFDKDRLEYTLTIPYGSEKFSIEGIPNVSTTSVIGNGEYSSNETEIILSTTAENGNNLNYKFNIVKALSNDATLSNLSVNGYRLDKTFLPTTPAYSIGEIPFNTTSLKINATSNNPDATINYYVDSVKQTSNLITIPNTLGNKTITIEVIAPDTIAKRTYTINYKIVKSSNAYLSNIIPSVGTINFNKNTEIYNLTVNNEITSIKLNITAEDENATITVNGNTYFTPKEIEINNLKVGTNTISILTTAQDGTTKKTYNVIVKRLSPILSNDANLKSLSITDYNLDKTFNMNTTSYNIGTIPYRLEKLTIKAAVNYSGATIEYYVDSVKQNSNVVSIPVKEGNKVITVKVTAEDGTIKNYSVSYNKKASTNAYLSNISVSKGTLAFNKNKTTYNVKLDNDVNTIDLTATTEDSGALMSINGKNYTSPHTITISPINLGNTEITIVVTAENGNVLTYKVVLEKETTLDTSITSNSYGHEIINNFIKTVKLNTTALELKDQLDNDNKYLEIWSSDETRKIADNETLSTGMIVKLIINDKEVDRKYIVIKGDTNGDGEIDLFDAVKILNDYLERVSLEGAYREAAFVNDDEDIDLFDSVMILNHYLGRISLH